VFRFFLVDEPLPETSLIHDHRHAPQRELTPHRRN
jgi:hypothetical protein